jgi:hypothetical protein
MRTKIAIIIVLLMLIAAVLILVPFKGEKNPSIKDYDGDFEALLNSLSEEERLCIQNELGGDDPIEVFSSGDFSASEAVAVSSCYTSE